MNGEFAGRVRVKGAVFFRLEGVSDEQGANADFLDVTLLAAAYYFYTGFISMFFFTLFFY